MAAVELCDVKKSFGTVTVIDGVDLTVEKGEFVVFVGPSGSGKSTLLRMIAGLETVSAGDVLIDEIDVTFAEPSDRGIAMVFQSYALYPHMNVYDNIAFNLRLSRLPKSQVDARVREAVRILHLEELLQRSPAQLSGGQRQRVAIGRAIVRNPKVFLFDEPLSNLDAALRVQMRLEIERLHRELGTTMIYVTHDQVEAMTLADRIVALDDGKIQQVGSPLELYANPANRFVAGFIGSPKMNFFDGSIVSTEADVATLTLSAAPQIKFERRLKNATARAPVTLGARPETLSLFAPDEEVPAGNLAMQAQVETVERLGNITYAYVNAGTDELVTVQIIGASELQSGQTVTLCLQPDELHVFNASGTAMTAADAP